MAMSGPVQGAVIFGGIVLGGSFLAMMAILVDYLLTSRRAATVTPIATAVPAVTPVTFVVPETAAPVRQRGGIVPFGAVPTPFEQAALLRRQ